MYDIHYAVPLVDLAKTRAPHFQIPLDRQSTLFDEPLVNLDAYGLPFLSWYAVTDGSNWPYCQPMAGSRPEGWLRKSVAEKLQRANQRLVPYNAELLVLDAYRSMECQVGLWNYFYERGRAQRPDASDDELRLYAMNYVRDPRQFDCNDARTFPIHGTGASIDVVLRQRDSGRWMNLGSRFDDIIDASVTDYFERQLLQGLIAPDDERLWNRRLMQWALHSEGFLNDPALYWHHDWGNQIWIKVKAATEGHAPAAAWYGYIAAPSWLAERERVVTPPGA